MSDPRPISPNQLTYARNLARKLHLPERMVDDHCVRRFGVTLTRLSMRQGSDLLDEMVKWEAIPAELQRSMGPRDLPGLGI